MSITADKNNHYKTIRKTCFTANTAYLLVHLVYLVLFLIAKLYVMVYIDAGAILAYALFYLVIKKEKYYPYALLCGNVFLAFITVSTIMLGFGSGFHLNLIGLCAVSFFTSYFSKVTHIQGSIIWVGLSLTLYLVLYFVTAYNAPYYAIERWLEITLFCIHAVAVFALIAGYLLIFLKYAVSLEKKIMYDSRTDELTQINNRYALFDYFKQEESNPSMFLALFDIDDFKRINDTHGHVAGDIVLKRIAEITSSALSDSFVCRFGGEEFVIVFENGKKENVFNRLEALRKQVENEVVEFEGKQIRVTITIGVSQYRDGVSLEKWIDLADEKMYKGKENGKNKTII